MPTDASPGGLLAFDFARSTGWCYAPPEYRPPTFARPDPMYALLRSGTEVLGKAGNRPGVVFLNLHKWLGRLLQEYRPRFLACEAPFVHTENMRGVLMGAGYLAVLEMHAHYNGDLPVIQVVTVSLKKHWTGSGRAQKTEMLDFAHQRGLNPGTHDEADAIAVCDYAVSDLLNSGAWPPRERRAA